MIWLEAFILFLYFGSLLFIFGYGLSQLHLVLLSRKFFKHRRESESAPNYFPIVTIQLPVYNEEYVVERLIDAVAKIDWPKDKLEIQILDDSTDDSVKKIAAKVIEYQDLGCDIKQVRREGRAGFKAGALAYGLHQAKGEFIAIFDADFVPNADFLKCLIPGMLNPKVGVMQARWGHLNRDYSLLTKLQAFGLDAHFMVEHPGRSEGKHFLNFNGTAGIWRKTCIEDAGGWGSDTLTEDLDLSYRAQLKGWEIHYLPEVDAPAELPIAMPAIKSQQFRWTKGAAETSRKLLSKVWQSDIKLLSKIHATYHLLNSTVFIAIVISALVSLPLLLIRNLTDRWDLVINISSIFIIGYLFLAIFYWTGFRRIYGRSTRTFLLFLPRMAMLLSIFLGLSVHNAIAVMEGWLGKKSPFIRTPKFNAMGNTGTWKGNKYMITKLPIITYLEGLLTLYFGVGLYMAFHFNDYALLPFHTLLTLGFFLVTAYSIKHSR
jgi:cellulose synthase/poly-beta-1,6-N-acetylglucosamine synthase-like glycosyltransferase